MINWISSSDEKNARKVDFVNLHKIIICTEVLINDFLK